MIEHDYGARVRSVAEADAWTQNQAKRLGVEVEDLQAAGLRGWCGEQIAALSIANAEDVLGAPPLDPEMAAAIERIRTAPVLPVSPRGPRYRI